MKYILFFLLTAFSIGAFEKPDTQIRMTFRYQGKVYKDIPVYILKVDKFGLEFEVIATHKVGIVPFEDVAFTERDKIKELGKKLNAYNDYVSKKNKAEKLLKTQELLLHLQINTPTVLSVTDTGIIVSYKTHKDGREIIFIECDTTQMADGDRFTGKIWFIGKYEYTTTIRSKSTIRKYTVRINDALKSINSDFRMPVNAKKLPATYELKGGEGKVLQLIKGGVLVSYNESYRESLGYPAQIIKVECDTEKYFDGDEFSLAGLWFKEMYKYSSAGNASKTIRTFTFKKHKQTNENIAQEKLVDSFKSEIGKEIQLTIMVKNQLINFDVKVQSVSDKDVTVLFKGKLNKVPFKNLSDTDIKNRLSRYPNGELLYRNYKKSLASDHQKPKKDEVVNTVVDTVIIDEMFEVPQAFYKKHFESLSTKLTVTQATYNLLLAVINKNNYPLTLTGRASCFRGSTSILSSTNDLSKDMTEGWSIERTAQTHKNKSFELVEMPQYVWVKGGKQLGVSKFQRYSCKLDDVKVKPMKSDGRYFVLFSYQKELKVGNKKSAGMNGIYNFRVYSIPKKEWFNYKTQLKDFYDLPAFQKLDNSFKVKDWVAFSEIAELNRGQFEKTITDDDPIPTRLFYAIEKRGVAFQHQISNKKYNLNVELVGSHVQANMASLLWYAEYNGKIYVSFVAHSE